MSIYLQGDCILLLHHGGFQMSVYTFGRCGGETVFKCPVTDVINGGVEHCMQITTTMREITKPVSPV